MYRAPRACGGTLVGFAKGAGMIEPDMATMLAFVLTDVPVGREQLYTKEEQDALRGEGI